MISLSLGYFVSKIFPFNIGELFRGIYLSIKQKQSWSIYFSSILMDRFLDLVILFAMSILFYIWDQTYEFNLFYAILLVAVFVFILLEQLNIIFLKKIFYIISSIFNSHIKLKLLDFYYSLHLVKINLLNKNQLAKVVCLTVLMWLSYLGSIYFLSQYISSFEATTGFSSVLRSIYFHEMYLLKFSNLSDLYNKSVITIFIYFFSPLFLILLYATFLKKGIIKSLSNYFPFLNWHLSLNKKNVFHYNKSEDQYRFYIDFFNNQSLALQNNYFENERNVIILKDISSGSNAKTWIVRESNAEFIRKIAFNNDKETLNTQLAWIQSFQDQIPITKIIKHKETQQYLYYDMPYDITNISFFEAIHSIPTSQSKSILTSILDQVSKVIHSGTRIQDSADYFDSMIKNYIEIKFKKNMDFIKNNLPSDLLENEDILINGRKYKNFNYFIKNKLVDRFISKISHFQTAKIHGDLTIENIIINLTKINQSNHCWYLIDPNPTNIFNSPLIDFAKLYQSLNKGYEFLSKVKLINFTGANINFTQYSSPQYSELKLHLDEYINRLHPQYMSEIKLHEIINYFRLLPYKIKKDPEQAIIYWAVTIILMNEYWENYV